jgi:hypothetical protein
MKRRESITFFDGLVFTRPLAMRSQESPTPVIGHLSSGSREPLC